MKSEIVYWAWLAQRLGIACSDLPRLMLQYHSPIDIYNAPITDIAKIDKISTETVERLKNKKLEDAMKIVDFCAGSDVRMLHYRDPDYPGLLRQLTDPPTLLYVYGQLPQMNDKLCVAIVGTRKTSSYGRSNAFRFAYELGAAGAVVVSGLALGIDGVAAGGAISGGGQTVAVLGCGIDRIYPAEHAALSRLVTQHGALVSEYPPGTSPEPQHFPLRNRLISGMCHGTLVVEAGERSGALITARYANSQGRQVFAVPGNLGSKSASGPNVLIRDGGLIAMEAGDIIDEYPALADRVDTISMQLARFKYEYSDDILARLGVCSRYVPNDERTVSTPKRPAVGTLIKPAVYGKHQSPAHAAMPTRPARPARPSRVVEPQGSVEPKPAEPAMATAAPSVSPHASASTPHEPPAPTKVQQAPQQPQKAPTPRPADHSAEVLASLDEKHRKMFAEMPDDRAVNTDALTRLGFTVGDVMNVMTTLEIYGLVSALPGGLYIKR